MRKVPSIEKDEYPLTIDDALERGFFTVQLVQKHFRHQRLLEEERNGRYQGFKGKPGNRRHYIVRFPGENVVAPHDCQFFLHDVKCMRDAKRLARKGGEGTVIQLCVERLRYINFGKDEHGNPAKLLIATMGKMRRGRYANLRQREYQYWILRDGEFVPHDFPVRTVVDDEEDYDYNQGREEVSL